MDYKQASKLNLILAIINLALVIVQVTCYRSTNKTITITMLVLFIAMFVVSKKYYKCPHCNHHIKMDDYLRKTCRNCGKPIE